MESNSEEKISSKTNSNSSIKFKENKICNDDEDIKMNKKTIKTCSSKKSIENLSVYSKSDSENDETHEIINLNKNNNSIRRKKNKKKETILLSDMEELDEKQNNVQDEDEHNGEEEYTNVKDEILNQKYIFCDNDNGIKLNGKNKYNNITRKQNKKIQNDNFIRNKINKINNEQLDNTYIDDDDLEEIECFEKTKSYTRKTNALEKNEESDDNSDLN